MPSLSARTLIPCRTSFWPNWSFEPTERVHLKCVTRTLTADLTLIWCFHDNTPLLLILDEIRMDEWWISTALRLYIVFAWNPLVVPFTFFLCPWECSQHESALYRYGSGEVEREGIGRARKGQGTVGHVRARRIGSGWYRKHFNLERGLQARRWSFCHFTSWCVNWVDLSEWKSIPSSTQASDGPYRKCKRRRMSHGIYQTNFMGYLPGNPCWASRCTMYSVNCWAMKWEPDGVIHSFPVWIQKHLGW